ncbi:hypothetical protein BaRGS_00016123 [Batillaria attramentaria]|uniref:Sodium channel protein n=1 Tax=Batillaria attramentaria TaxID=370345 RepID=A0ABD0KZI6_9CAEN
MAKPADAPRKSHDISAADTDPNPNTFLIVSTRFGKLHSNQFSSAKSLFLFSPRNPIRRFALRVYTNEIFHQFIIIAILVNCVFLTMPDLSWASLTENDSYPVTTFACGPLDDLACESPGDLACEPPGDLAYGSLGDLACGPLVDLAREQPGDLACEPPGDLACERPGDLACEPPGDLAREPPGDLACEPLGCYAFQDYVSMIAMTVTLILESTEYSSDVGNINGLRTFRVLRALKTVSIIPGLKILVDAFFRACRNLLEVTRSTSVVSGPFFLVVIFFGSYYLMNLMLAVVAMSYEQEAEAKRDSEKLLPSGKVPAGVQQVSKVGDCCKCSLLAVRNIVPASECCSCQCSILRCFQSFVYNIVSTLWFDFAVTISIILNTFILAMEHHGQSHSFDSTLKDANYFFTAVFTFEAVFKIIAFGKDYFRNGWNQFDLFVVIIGFLDLIFESVGGLNSVRSFRLLRVVKLAQSWVTMHILLTIIIDTLGALVNLTIVLALIIFIFAVIGLQLFREAYRNFDFGGSEGERWHFKDFFHSSLMVFRILCGEWVEPLWECMRAYSWVCMLVFLPTLIIGNFIALNLFLALLLNAFASDTIEELKGQIRESKVSRTVKRFKSFVSDRVLGIQLFSVKDSLLERSGSISGPTEAAVTITPPADHQGGAQIRLNSTPADADKRLVLSVKHEGNTDTAPGSITQLDHAVAGNKTELPETEKRPDDTGSKTGLGQPEKPSARASNSTDLDVAEKTARTKADTPSRKVTLGSPVDPLHLSVDSARNTHSSRLSPPEEREIRPNTTPDVSSRAVSIATKMVSFPAERTLSKTPTGAQDQTPPASPARFRSTLGDIKKVRITPEDRLKFSEPPDCFPEICTRPCCTPENRRPRGCWWKFRSVMLSIVDNKWFEGFILFVIFGSSFALIPVANIVGEQYGRARILRFRAVRTLRALRPLRAISHWQGMRIVVNSLVRSIPSIINVFLVGLLFWLIFSIMGVQLFKGKFYKCVNNETGQIQQYTVTPNKSVCLNTPGHIWKNSEVNFDNAAAGFLPLFQVATFEGWMEVMRDAVDSTEIDEQPRFENNKYIAYMYFVVFILFGSLFTLNLFVSVIIDSYLTLTKKYDFSAHLTEREKTYYNAMKTLVKTKRSKKSAPPQNLYMRYLTNVVLSDNFDFTIRCVIMLSLATLAMESYDMPPQRQRMLALANAAFGICYIIEAVLKLIVLRMKYFKDAWNIFDFVIVVLVCIHFAIFKLDVKSNMISPAILRIFQVVRVTRATRLMKWTVGIRRLLYTLMISLPAILSIGSLLLLIIFIYAIMGMSAFGDIRVTGALNDHVNFRTFTKSSMLLIRLATAAGWNDILDALLIQPPHCDPHFKTLTNGTKQPSDFGDCGIPWLAIPYMVSYIVIVYLIVINMYIAVILEHYYEAQEQKESDISGEVFDMFYEVWERYDPEGTQFINYAHLSDFVAEIEQPLRIKKPNKITVNSFNLNIMEGDMVHFLDVLLALLNHSIGIGGESEALRLLYSEMEDKLNEMFPSREKASVQYTTLQRQKFEVAARAIQRAWRMHKKRKLLFSRMKTVSRTILIANRLFSSNLLQPSGDRTSNSDSSNTGSGK